MTRELKYLTLSQASPLIFNADLLLFRGKGIVSATIQRLGRGDYSHAAKASWHKNVLECAEVRELKGGEIVTLESQVAAYPGQIDVFHANALGLPEMSAEDAAKQGIKPRHFYDREGADAMMRSFAGTPYGYLAILKTFVIHSPLMLLVKYVTHWIPCLWPLAKYVGDLYPQVTNDSLKNGQYPYCSAAASIADELGGGVDPVPELADAYTEPSDLSRSLFYRGFDNEGYICTLIPNSV